MLTCKIGATLTFDAVAYVRGQIEDTTSTPLIPDSTLQLYVEAAAEEFSRWVPLGEHVVGNIGANPPTSPLNTILNVNRYPASVANGFLYPVEDIIDVSYTPSGVFNAANEYAYLALTPASPFSAFISESSVFEKPSSRIIRAGMFNELSHYNHGFFSTSLDAAGNKVIDLYPTPLAAGTPIFVRYTSSHINVPDGQNNPQYPTIPENLKRYFAKFLLAEVLDQESDRLARSATLRAGVMQRSGDGKSIRARAAELRSEVETALGSSVTVGIVSH